MNQPSFQRPMARDPFRTHTRMTSRDKIGAAGDGSINIPVWYSIMSTVGVAAGAYHGYKRNDSIGWALGWAFLGGLFPFVTIPVALAQGFGERKR